MSFVKQLFQLQEVDLEIDHHQEYLAVIESQLEDETSLVGPKNEVTQQRDCLVQLRRKERESDSEYADMSEKIQNLESKLYSGNVRNSRELEGMQNELGYFKNHQHDAEEQLLEFSLAVEEAQRVLASAEERLGRIENGWQAQQEELRLDRATRQRELITLQKRRNGMNRGIPDSDLAIYQHLRKSRSGCAVSRVERGLCLGCRISLSINQFQRVRTSQEPVLCSSCGRILYLS